MISAPFTTVFFSTTGIRAGSAPSELGGVTIPPLNTVTLDGYIFDLSLRETEISAQDTFRDNVAQNAEANDTLFNARGAWGRYQFSLHHGAGQKLSDLDPDADSFRFDTSIGIDWSTKYQLQLTKSSTNQRTVASTAPVLIRSGDFLFASDGATLYRTPDLVTWTAMTAPGGTILCMATDGTDLYVGTSTVSVRYLGTATTPTAYGTAVVGPVTNIAFCSGRLLMAKANVLYECAATGVLTVVKTHFQAAFSWTTIFNVGSKIYAGGFAGSKSELYTVSTDSGGNLVLALEAAPFPIGELLRTGLSFAGIIMLCTSAGIRIAEATGDGTVTYGPLISDPGDVRAITGDGRFAFFGWSTMEGSRSGVGRAALDIDVAPLQPAYGTDVYETITQAAVTGVARLSGCTAYAVAGSGIWVENTAAYVGQGETRSGRISFGTVEPKAVIGLTATFRPLLAGESVEVIIYDQYGVIINDASQSTVNATTLDIDLAGEKMPYCTITTRLLGPGTSTPTLLQWRLRAYPIPPAVQQFILALVVRDAVLINGDRGQAIGYKADDVYTWIESLWSTRRYTMLRIGTRSYRVRCEQFKWELSEWAKTGDLPVGKLIVQLIDA